MDGVQFVVGTGRVFAEDVKAAWVDRSAGSAAPAGRRPADCIMEEREERESSAVKAGSAGRGMDLGSDEGSGAAVLSFETALSKALMAAVTVTAESLKCEWATGTSRSKWEEDLSACWIKVSGVIVV